jgi:hypothetical protein
MDSFLYATILYKGIKQQLNLFRASQMKGAVDISGRTWPPF